VSGAEERTVWTLPTERRRAGSECHLQLSDLAAKLAGLEASVSRLEGEISSAAHRSVGHEAREAHEAITEDVGGLSAEPSDADVHTRLVELPHDCRPTNTSRAR
jgi:hypothetical protein